MKKLLGDVDRLLRGGLDGDPASPAGPVTTGSSRLCMAALLLGVAYGIFMGLYAVLRAPATGVPQLLATMAKVPLLFLLTLVVTFPSLYVFSALVDSPLRWGATARLLLAAIVVDLALVASFGPITGFFTLSTESYPFMIVLNVLFFALGGIAGLLFLYRVLNRVLAPVPGKDGQAATRSKRIFLAWIFIYAAVGAQMGWILRPFIGSPNLPFSFFRARGSNFFEALLRTIGRLFS
jgi:hypothetical protein